MIPKIIHLCVFSLCIPPIRVRKCLWSWKKNFPDYKIMLWTRKKALATGIPFVKEAIDAKKWAFACDAVRLYAVNKYGGLYMDWDVFVYKNFDELLCHKNVFFSERYPDRVEYEKEHPELEKVDRWGQEIQAACFAAEKGSQVVSDLLEYYKKAHFINPDGSLNMSPVSPQVFAWSLEKYGYRYTDEEQLLADDTVVYPSSMVLSNQAFTGEDPYAKHICMQSWK